MFSQSHTFTRTFIFTLSFAALLMMLGSQVARAQEVDAGGNVAATAQQEAGAIDTMAVPEADGDADAAAAHGDEAASVVAPHGEVAEGEGEGHGEHHGDGVKPLWIIPFVVLLGFIALAPLVNAHWWEHHYPKVAAVLFAIGLIYYGWVRQDFSAVSSISDWYHGAHKWMHGMQEYVSFIALLFALFVVSGGIVIHVSRKATPLANCTLLLTGAVIANIFGTTGAAMLLIRPYIRINRKHIKPYHIIFFIFLVANVGGCLTPIGDPPLFLGYLKGVPFWWVLEHCWTEWAVGTLVILLIFFIIDKLDHAKEERFEDPEHDSGPAVRINGIHNFLFILIVLVAVFQPSIFEIIEQLTSKGVTFGGLLKLIFNREVLMVATAITSKLVTKPGVYEWNEFTWAPIREVAILFVAIFSTMAPALEWLDYNAEKLPLKSVGNFYFTTGGLSSVLDNAPTYLTFLQARVSEVDSTLIDQAKEALKMMHEQYVADPTKGLVIPDLITNTQVRQALNAMVQYHAVHIQQGIFQEDEIKIAFLVGVPEMNLFLVAISVGAVFFGACTYIGNAPNFMVKSIAESAGIKMPSFLGYVFRYTLPILIPTYIAIWFIFFSGYVGGMH